MRHTDFNHLKAIGGGWTCQSSVLGDFSHYIIPWNGSTNMRAEDVTDTLRLALKASNYDSVTVLQGPS